MHTATSNKPDQEDQLEVEGEDEEEEEEVSVIYYQRLRKALTELSHQVKEATPTNETKPPGPSIFFVLVVFKKPHFAQCRGR